VIRRQTVMDAVQTALKAARTLASDRVYIDRTVTIEPDRSDDAPPLIAIYFPEMTFKRDGGASSRWTETSMFVLECWAVVNPGRAVKTAQEGDRLQSKALNTLTQQAVNGLLNNNDFMCLFAEPPNVKMEFGLDRNSKTVVGCSRVVFEYIHKGSMPQTDVPEYDDLQTLWTDHEVRGSTGDTTPDPEVLSEHPDLQQISTDLDQE